jgi:hypothetical protein
MAIPIVAELPPVLTITSSLETKLLLLIASNDFSTWVEKRTGKHFHGKIAFEIEGFTFTEMESTSTLANEAPRRFAVASRSRLECIFN